MKQEEWLKNSLKELEEGLKNKSDKPELVHLLNCLYDAQKTASLKQKLKESSENFMDLLKKLNKSEFENKELKNQLQEANQKIEKARKKLLENCCEIKSIRQVCNEVGKERDKARELIDRYLICHDPQELKQIQIEMGELTTKTKEGCQVKSTKYLTLVVKINALTQPQKDTQQ